MRKHAFCVNAKKKGIGSHSQFWASKNGYTELA